MRLAWIGAALACLLVVDVAHALEDEWHLGANVGLATADFPESADLPAFTATGFGAGLHLTYGLNDAINLRGNADFSIADLPDPATSAQTYHGALGAEYVLDTIDWVVYGGLLIQGEDVAIQDGPHLWNIGLEIPLGLSYRLSDRFAVGIEPRIRMPILGAIGTPTAGFLALGRFEYIFNAAGDDDDEPTVGRR